MSRRHTRLVATMACVIAMGCSVDAGGGTSFGGSGGGTSGTGGASAESGTTEPEDNGLVCEAECVEANDCCVGFFPAGACPGAFPNNWACSGEGKCVTQGCSGHADCPLSAQECRAVNGVNTCVYPCGTSGECINDYNLQGTTCAGRDDQYRGYCSGNPTPDTGGGATGADGGSGG